METLFDYSIPSENNRLSFFSRFSELKLFTYINEFELMMGLFIEESVNIDYIIYINKIIKKLLQNIIINFIVYKIIYYNTS